MRIADRRGRHRRSGQPRGSCASGLTPSRCSRPNDYAGGHTHTVDVTLDGVTHPVDTGFLVYNDRTYPGLCALFDELGVAKRRVGDVVLVPRRRRPARMGRHQSRRAVRAAPQRAAARVLADARRHRALQPRRRPALARDATVVALSLGEFLDRSATATRLRDWYLLPMAAAIWSAPRARDPRFSAAGVRPLLPQPRPAAADRPPALAHRQRRGSRLRRADRRATCPMCASRRRSAPCAGGRSRSRSTAAPLTPSGSTRSCSPATAIRRAALLTDAVAARSAAARNGSLPAQSRRAAHRLPAPPARAARMVRMEPPRRRRSRRNAAGRSVVPDQQAAAAAVLHAGDRHAQSADRARRRPRWWRSSSTRTR